MAAVTTPANFTTLANQAFQGAAAATDDTTRDALIAMGKRFEARAAQERSREAAADTARREFWANQSTVTNWVS